MSVILDRVVPWGRSRREYELMFALSPADLRKRILGCGDGPASFNAEASAAGVSVVSIDPLYELCGLEIRRRFEATVEEVIQQVIASPDDWTWSFHRDPDDLRRNRRAVMDAFLADYDRGRREGRYLVAKLPHLPFADGSFDLAVCSHLLFLYSDLLSQEFHIRSVLELCRVAREVRIFPLLTLARQFSPHIEPVRRALAEVGVDSKIESVEYELQKGGNQMLRCVVHNCPLTPPGTLSPAERQSARAKSTYESCEVIGTTNRSPG